MAGLGLALISARAAAPEAEAGRAAVLDGKGLSIMGGWYGTRNPDTASPPASG